MAKLTVKQLYYGDEYGVMGEVMGAFNYCKNLIIYCEAESQPSGWDIMWNYCGVEHKNGTYYCPIFWGHKG